MTDKTTDEIKRSANAFLSVTLDDHFRRLGLKIKLDERHDEWGIDYIVEIANRDKEDRQRIYGVFYLQNKGKDEVLTPLTTTANSGFISFELKKLRHIVLAP